MSEKMQPDIQQTAREKVLIKHNTISAFRYAKHITKQAHKQVTENYQKAQQEIEHIRHVAYQQGYQDGLKQLLSNMIESIEMSEKRFQQQLSQSKEQLLHQLSEFSTINYYKQSLLNISFNNRIWNPLFCIYRVHYKRTPLKKTLILNLYQVKMRISP
ncbi:hypothetical protein [Providencia sp. PROV149]|uniref:hypothetical protein n=1 Tax=Providencia sp. PROV149 TaxID=2949859 RepID=UPI0023490100|nr:hypothetical protein [Providencia sp. PROV149]